MGQTNFVSPVRPDPGPVQFEVMGRNHGDKKLRS